MLSRIYSPNRSEEGFTLIELLIVVIIIGILAAIALPIFLNQQKAAADASVQSDVRNTLDNIQTWQVSNQNKAEANTAAYVTDGGKVVQTGSNTVSVVVNTDGSYQVCGYTANGSQFTSSSAAYTYDSTSGKFATGACASGAGGTGGTSGPVGSINGGNYVVTAESGDPTNTLWTFNSPGAVAGFSTVQAHSGTSSVSLGWTSSTVAQANLAIGNEVPGKSTTVSGYMYENVVSGVGPATGLVMYVKNGGTVETNKTFTIATASRGTWVPFTYTYTAGAAEGSTTNLQFQDGGVSNGTGSIYIDDITVTQN